MKIAIIGCPGSGKTTLAKKLAAQLSLPLYHLDQYYWLPGWRRLDRAVFEKAHHRLCDQDVWIIEGVASRLFSYRAACADVIIFLDVPWYTCLYRVCKRSWTLYGSIRKDSAPGCPERLPDKEFLTYIWNFEKKTRQAILAILREYQNRKKVYIVRDTAEYDECLKRCSNVLKN